jgi:hypothetical protein
MKYSAGFAFEKLFCAGAIHKKMNGFVRFAGSPSVTIDFGSDQKIY